MQVETTPSPLVATRHAIETGLCVSRRGRNPLDGELVLTAPEGWRIAPDRFSIEDARLHAPFASAAKLTAPDKAGPGVYRVHAALHTAFSDYTHTLPAMLLGDGSGVEVREKGDLIEVANGRMRLRVAPAFYGSVISIETDDAEHLVSPYPEAGNFGWMRPWHGGVHPFIHWNPGELHKESFLWEEAACQGTQGVAWRGVKVLCEPKHKELRGLRIEVAYLTAGGSNVVAVVSRYVNRTSAPRDFHAGIVAFAQPGGSREDLEGVVERHGVVHHKKHTLQSRDLRGDNWIAIHNSRSDDAAVLVSTAHRKEVFVDDSGIAGMHLSAAHNVRIEPEEANEAVCYFVLTKGIEQARAYAVLSRLDKLP